MAREADVREAVDWLRRQATAGYRDGMLRFAIPNDKALGVPMPHIKALGKKLGPDQELAVALWETDVYEARMLASFVGDPKLLTGEQMDLWRAEFDNWAICDGMCFNLFDRSAPRWEKVEAWSGLAAEFEKRASFALLWGLTVHDKRAPDDGFLRGLELIEREATDPRNFVRKAVNMALRAVGKRNRALNAAALETSRRLAASADATARWVGKDALRELTGASVTRRLERK